MSTMAVCPRCHTSLPPAAEGVRERRCETCYGTFKRPGDGTPVESSDESSHGSPDATPAETAPSETAPTVVPTAAPPTAANAAARVAPPVGCPHCLTHMQPVGQNADADVFACPSCGSRWEDGDPHPEQPPAGAAMPAGGPDADGEPALSPFTRSLLYGVSLPERLLRSGVGLTAGAAKEVAAFVVPQAFQTSKSYEIAIDNSLCFLTETIGGVEGPAPAEDEAGEHIARKAVGNFVDLAGLATLHVSPMWVLAAVSDIAYGTRTYVNEVAQELQKQGVIDETSTIHNMDDILDAIQRVSGSAASAIDRPPLSVDDLRETLEQTRRDLNKADLTKLLPEAEVRRLWEEMQSVATQENVGLLSLSSAITMQSLNGVKTVTDGTLTGIRVAGGLFNRSVIDHYRNSLTNIREQGFYEIVRESYEPYVTAVWTNFSAERKTWTESLLDPNNISRTVGKLFAFLDPSDPSPTASDRT